MAPALTDAVLVNSLSNNYASVGGARRQRVSVFRAHFSATLANAKKCNASVTRQYLRLLFRRF